MQQERQTQVQYEEPRTTAVADAVGEFGELLRRPRYEPPVIDDALISRAMQLGQVMATGKATVPKDFVGNVGDCTMIAMQALMWGMNPFAVIQKCFFVNGRIGYEAQLIVAAINCSGVLKERMRVVPFGPWEKILGKFQIRKNQEGKEYRVPDWTLADEEGLGMDITATIVGETEPRTLRLLLAQARTRNSTLWGEDPLQQFTYLIQKRWARIHVPEVILGVYSHEELDSVGVTTADPALLTGRRTTSLAALTAPAQDETLKPVITLLENAARLGGYEGAKTGWKSLDESMRTRVGETERNRIAQIGRDVDAERERAAAKPDPATGEITTAAASPTPAPAPAALSGKRRTLSEFAEQMKAAKDGDARAMVLDTGRSELGADSADFAVLVEQYKKASA